MTTTMGRKRTPPKEADAAPSKMRRAFAENLHELALAGHRTASDIADHMGVSHDAVLKWLRGETLPDLERWPALAEALGVKDYRNLLPKL